MSKEGFVPAKGKAAFEVDHVKRILLGYQSPEGLDLVRALNDSTGEVVVQVTGRNDDLRAVQFSFRGKDYSLKAGLFHGPVHWEN